MVNFKEEKCLIACYSCEGDNIVSGKLVNLSMDNPELIMKITQKMVENNFCGNFDFCSDYHEISNGYINELFSFLKFQKEEPVENNK